MSDTSGAEKKTTAPMPQAHREHKLLEAREALTQGPPTPGLHSRRGAGIELANRPLVPESLGTDALTGQFQEQDPNNQDIYFPRTPEP